MNDNLESEVSAESLSQPLTEFEEMPTKIIDAKSELTYHCTVEGCTSHFFTHVALRKHVETVHNTFTFACYVCGKRYKHQFSLKEHLLSHNEQKTHLCDICGKAFRTKDLCANHKLLHGNRKLSCTNCGATFKQRNVLHQHKIACEGVKRFTCDICGKNFTTKQNRNAHVRIHTGETPYQCEICKIFFKRVHHFNKHLHSLNHINQVQNLKYQNQDIPSHLDPKFVLGDESGEITNLLMNHSTCEICPKTDGSVMKFKSSYHFSKHIRSRAHMDRILQISHQGESVSAHLIPPTIINQENAD